MLAAISGKLRNPAAHELMLSNCTNTNIQPKRFTPSRINGIKDTAMGRNRALAKDTARMTNSAETPAACISAKATCPGNPQMPAVELSAMPIVRPLSFASDPNPVMLANNMIDGKPRASLMALR